MSCFIHVSYKISYYYFKFNLFCSLVNGVQLIEKVIKLFNCWGRKNKESVLHGFVLFCLFVFLFFFFRNFFGSEGLSSQRKVKILERLLAMLADIPHGYKNRTEVTMKNDISAPACWWANAQYVFCCCLNWVSTIICKCAKWSGLFHFFPFFKKKY